MKKKIILIATIPIILLMLYSVNIKYKEEIKVSQNEKEVKENKTLVNQKELLAYTCDECETLPSTFPKKGQGYVGLGVTCTNGATATWDNEDWDVDFTNLVIPTACTVEFTPLYNVTATAPNGTVTGSPKEVAHGGLAAFEVIPNANYEYSSLSNCTGGSYDESTNTLTIRDVKSNIACQVNFSLIKRTVTVTASGGTVTGSPKEVTHGSTVTFTVTPEEGEEVVAVTVTDKNGNVLEVKQVGENEYSFVMPKSEVDINVTMDTVHEHEIVLTVGNNTYYKNDDAKHSDVAPVIVGERTLVPIRLIVEALGGEVVWDDATRTVIMNIDGKVLTLVIDQEIPGFGTGAIIMNGRTMVPIRYVSEYVGADVEWIAETQQVIIRK